MAQITAEKVQTSHGDRIWVRFPYDPGLVAKIKNIPGRSWLKTESAWSLPLHMRVCYSLREQFGSDLVIGPELTAWAREAVKHEERMARHTSATDAELERVPATSPVLADAMASRTYQRVGARFIADGRNVLIADQPGLGKTLETIGGIIEAGVVGPVLILSLKTAVNVVWRNEIMRWFPTADITVATGTGAEKDTIIEWFWERVASEPEVVHFLITNPESIRTKLVQEKGSRVKWYEHKHAGLFRQPWSAIVIDESAHNQSSLIVDSANEAKMSQFRLGAKYLPVADDGLKIALSGTPMRGKPKHLWGTLNWLQPHVYTSFWNWVGLYHRVTKEGGAYGVPEHMVIGELVDEVKLYNDLQTIMLRRTKAEVLKDLPAKQYGGSPLDPSDPNSPVGIWVPMEGAQAKAYKQMTKDATATLDGGSLTANGVLAELTRLKQFANSAATLVNGQFTPCLPSNKFDAVVGLLEERGITGNPDTEEGDSQVVIASQFTETIELFAAELIARGINVAVLTGKTKEAERTRLIQEFQGEGGPRVFLLNTRAGGVAVTLDKADDLFILDETWLPDDQEQVEDRIHRASRIHQVTIYYIRSLGSVDEMIARNNVTADTIQKGVIDGARELKRLLMNGG